MWDLETALLAIAGGALALPPVAPGVGGFCAVIGMLGVLQGPYVGADGSGARAAGVVRRSLVVRGAPRACTTGRGWRCG